MVTVFDFDLCSFVAKKRTLMSLESRSVYRLRGRRGVSSY